MRPELLALAADLSRRGERFALATVVRREPPSSAQVGDAALITQQGAFHGWLGGSCTQPTVLDEARRAMDDGRPRLIALSPVPDPHPRPGVTSLPMTCHSGGRVDIYIEPVLPAPLLVVYGVSPAARSLARLAKVLGYRVDAVDPDADIAAFPEADHVVTDYASADFARRLGALARRPAVVVATLGVRDEAALEHALGYTPAYLGLVASRTRFGEMTTLLRDRGITDAALATIRCPAGLDLGAATPEEVALSILAEMVQRGRAERPVSAPAPPPAAHAVDPICGMSVNPATAKHRAEYLGQTYYFCCGGCRTRFLADPMKYATAPTPESPA